jgi:hypothetical protein
VRNAAEEVAPVVTKQEALKQAYRQKAMEMGYAAAEEDYKDALTQKRDIQKLLMQEQIKGMGADGMSNVGKAVRDFDPTLKPGTPEYQTVFERFANYMYGNAAGKAIASGDPRVISLTTNPQYIQEKKQIEDEFNDASTRAAYGPNGATQWEADRQAKLDALKQRYISMGAGATSLVPGAPSAAPSAPGIIPPPSPMNQAPGAPNVVPRAENVAPSAQNVAPGAAPVSVRKNNPLNVVDTNTGEIKTFDTPGAGSIAGYADLVKKLSGSSVAYKRRFGDAPITPARLAEVWSPALAKGNTPESTANYAKVIASAAGISPEDTIDPTPETINRIYQAMAGFEAGTLKMPETTAAPVAATPSVAPSLTPAAKPGARLFITPAQEEAAKVVAQAQGKADALKIPGTPEYIKFKEDQSKDQALLQRLDDTSTAVLGDINKLIETKINPKTKKEEYKLKPGLAASVGSMEGTGIIGGTKGFFSQDIANRRAYIEGLKNKLSVQGLEELRKAGTAPGSITEKEWPLFQSAIATLSTTIDDKEFANQLIKVKQALENLKAKAKVNYAKKYEGVGTTPDMDTSDILGIRKPK